MEAAARRLSGLRPQNSPVRRMAAAASIFASGDSLSQALAKIPVSDFKPWHEKILMIFKPSNDMNYWNRRLSFSGAIQKSDIALVGPDRIGAVESNVFLPFLATRGISLRRLLSNLPPEQDNSVIRLCAMVRINDRSPSRPTVCRRARSRWS